MYKVLSDEKCISGPCNLKLGASSSFKSKSDRRRECIKHFGYAYLKLSFDSKNGKKILTKCDEKTKEKFPDIISGERKTMLTCPPHFIYTSKLKGDFSVLESEIEKMIKDKKYENTAELKEILEFRKIYLPQAGERDIFNPLIGSFFHYPGIFVNGFEPNQYLKEFHKAAEDMRNIENARTAHFIVQSWMPSIVKHFPESGSKYVNKIKGEIVIKELNVLLKTQSTSGNTLKEIKKRLKNDNEYTEDEIKNNLQSALTCCSFFELNKRTYKFNELEEKILECNGSSEREIEELVDNMLVGLENQQVESIVAGKKIIDSIEKFVSMKSDLRINKFLLKKFKSQFLPKTIEKSHILGDVKTFLKYILYDHFIKPPGEWDFLVILSRLKIILNVEVKQQINLKNREKQNLNNSLKSASHQCEEHADYAARIFTPFLSPDWQFVKIAAILPGELDDSTICKHCNQFIITGNTEEEIQKKINDIRDRLISLSTTVDAKEAEEDLVALTKVLVGLSFISTDHPYSGDPGSAWRQIQGSNPDHISLSAGWTRSDLESAPNEMIFKKILGQPSNINKLVYYNVDQQHILANKLTLVILKGDFGAGIISCIDFNMINCGNQKKLYW